MFDANVRNPFRDTASVTFSDQTLKAGDNSAKGTPVPTARSVGQRNGSSMEMSDETERFLFVLTTRDPTLPRPAPARPSKAGEHSAAPAWTQATTADEADRGNSLGIAGNTGLLSPSPSPEDGVRRKPVQGSTMVATKESTMTTTMTMLDTPAETETSPAMMTASAQETRGTENWTACTLVGNSDAKYDHTTWRDLPDLYSDLQVAVALVETTTSAEPAEGSESSLVRTLVRSAEDRLDKVKGVEKESSWWMDFPGGTTAMGGFLKHKYAVEVEAEVPKPAAESDKNTNGESDVSLQHVSRLNGAYWPRFYRQETYLDRRFSSRTGPCQRSKEIQGRCSGGSIGTTACKDGRSIARGCNPH